jgi:hypothetical protein
MRRVIIFTPTMDLRDDYIPTLFLFFLAKDEMGHYSAV